MAHRQAQGQGEGEGDSVCARKRAKGSWPAALPTSGLDCPIAASSHADIRRFACWIVLGCFGNYQKGAPLLARTFRWPDRRSVMLLGRVDAVRTAQSRLIHRLTSLSRSRPTWNRYSRHNTDPGLWSTECCEANSRMLIAEAVSHVGIRTLSRVVQPHIMAGPLNTIMSRLVQPPPTTH